MNPTTDDPHDSLDSTTRRKLDRGEVVVTTEPIPGSKLPLLVVRAVVEAVPARVWAVIDACSEYYRFMPRVKGSQEVRREGDLVWTRTTIEMPFPLRNLVSLTRATHTVVPDERYVRAWVLEEGTYKENTGSWILVPFDGAASRTFVTYQVHVIPNIPIPKRLQGVAQSRSMPQMIDALRKWVASRPS